MIQTSRAAAANPNASPMSASHGEVWNRLSPRSPKKNPTSGEMMSREGIASRVAALRMPDGSRFGSSGFLSCGGAMRADLGGGNQVRETFHKPWANRNVSNG